MKLEIYRNSRAEGLAEIDAARARMRATTSPHIWQANRGSIKQWREYLAYCRRHRADDARNSIRRAFAL